MKPQGIAFKIILPIVAFMSVLAIFAALRTLSIIDGIMHDYHDAIIAQERDEILNIAGEDLSEDQIMDVIKRHFSTENYRYRVMRGDQVLMTCCDFPPAYQVGADGSLSAEYGGVQYYGNRIGLNRYGLTVEVMREYPKTSAFRRQLNSTITVFAISVMLMILCILVVLRKNLAQPIRRVMDRIHAGERAPLTGVMELDGLGDALNHALATAELRHLQADTLHDIAVSLNQDRTAEEIMQTIVEQSKVLINADMSAIALYDEKGEFSKLKVFGVDEARLLRGIGRMPQGEGILKLMKLSIAPVKINEVASHPAFSGAFPKGHPVIRNFLGYPIFSKDGRPLGALYFANKGEGDFTAEDEELLMAVASDAAVAIQRVSDTAELGRFKQIIESSFDVIVITDSEGMIIYVNPAFEAVTGYDRRDVLGQNPRVLKSGMHDDGFYRDMWDRIRAGRPWQGEFVNRKKNGDLYNASAVIFPVFTEGGKIANYVSIQRDMTEEKRLYGQLMRAQKMEAIGTLAGGIAHDFNNLLSAIIGYAEIIREDLPEDHPHYRQAGIIENSAKRGAELASRILNATRVEKVEYRVVDLNAVVRDTLELLARTFAKDISIETRLDPELPAIRANVSQIQQVIMNLAVNARDAMPDGGRIVIETAGPSAAPAPAAVRPRSEGFVRLGISDTGRGMDADTMQKVFDPFFTTKSRGAGTGLGLYIVHSIVTNHGGYINLSSSEGSGTTMHVFFPVCPEPAEEADAAPEEDLSGSGTILVIEDEADVRSLATDVLERLGYRVIAAADGTEGVAIFRGLHEEIDLILLDMIMPVMNGSEVFQVLRGIRPDVRVVIVSGYSTEGLSGINRLLGEGALQFVQKPFTQKALARAVKAAIQNRP